MAVYIKLDESDQSAFGPFTTNSKPSATIVWKDNIVQTTQIHMHSLSNRMPMKGSQPWAKRNLNENERVADERK